MLTFFAHEGESHASPIDDVAHLFVTEWYVAVPLIFFGLAALGWISFRLTRSLGFAYIVMAAGMLVAGVALYKLSPIASVVNLSIGFAFILLLVLTGLRAGRK